MPIRTLITAFCFALSPIAVAAQHNSATTAPSRLIISETAVADALAAEQPALREDRDSLKNGALIGAIIGGAALGGFVTFLCNALQAPSDPSCVPPSLLYTGIGAGIGAAAGAGIDALFARSASAPVTRWAFPKTPPAAIRVTVPLRPSTRD
jgi:hypothetical protein